MKYGVRIGDNKPYCIMTSYKQAIKRCMELRKNYPLVSEKITIAFEVKK